MLRLWVAACGGYQSISLHAASPATRHLSVYQLHASMHAVHCKGSEPKQCLRSSRHVSYKCMIYPNWEYCLDVESHSIDFYFLDVRTLQR
jgi:hypothetical protein